jgi:hypothetical protein
MSLLMNDGARIPLSVYLGAAGSKSCCQFQFFINNLKILLTMQLYASIIDAL